MRFLLYFFHCGSKFLWFINGVIYIRHICLIFLSSGLVIILPCLKGENILPISCFMSTIANIPAGSWECRMNYAKLAVISSRPVWVCVVECRNNPYKHPIKKVASQISNISSTFYQCNKIRRGICTNAGIADKRDLAWENVSFQHIRS